MQKILRNTFILAAVLVINSLQAQTQNWQPSMKGILDSGFHSVQSMFTIKFKTNGPFGKDWIYGHWYDDDTLQRCVGYREGGKWKSLPFSVNIQSQAYDIVQYGDTLYIGGVFQEIVLEKTGDTIPLIRGWTPIIKVFNDSIWASDAEIYHLRDMAVSGDSLLCWVGHYISPSGAILGSHILSTNGTTWDNAFPAYPPTGANFGTQTRLDFKDGHIYSLNNNGPTKGVVKWDGQQWYSLGNGLNGYTNDFEFFQNYIYIIGSFNKANNPLNSEEYIVHWDGFQWVEVGGGLGNFASDLFIADKLLYCQMRDSGFGDASIKYLAAWDGQQWCGTPIIYTGSQPLSFGVINDTLYGAWKDVSATANGQTLSFLNYFDGDYLNGPNSICSTMGIGKEENETADQKIEIYPNPAANTIQIKSIEKYSINQINITDLNGKVVMERSYSTHQNLILLDISHLISGMYIIRISSDESILMEKIQIAK